MNYKSFEINNAARFYQYYRDLNTYFKYTSQYLYTW